MRIYNLFTLVYLSFLSIQASSPSEKYEGEERSKPIIVIYGCLWPEGHFGREVAHEFAKEVAEKTNNKLMVEITPPSADSKLTEKVISGEIHMTSGHGIQGFVPELGLTYLPYLYSSFEHFKEVWTFGKTLASNTLVARAEQKLPAVKIMGYSLIGYRDFILTQRSIAEETDFEDLRVRVDGSDSAINTLKALGATPVTIEYHKVKEALRNRTIDAAENSPFNLIYMEWYKECKNISLTKHLMLLNVELINTDFWNKLSPEYQEVLKRALQKSTSKFSDIAFRARDKAISELKDQYGLSVNEISLEALKQLNEKVINMKQEFVNKYDLQKEYDWIVSLTNIHS